MIRILHLIDTWGPGGAETVCLSIASGLDPSRFRSRVLVTGEDWLHGALTSRGIETVVTPVRRPLDDIRLVASLAAQIIRFRPHVLQCHLLNSALYGTALGRVSFRPAVVTFHGHTDIKTDDPHGALKLRLITKAARRVVFVSDALRQAMCERASLPADRARVICNGVDPEVYRPARSRRLRDELRLADDARIVGAVGNTRVAKGYETFLRVAHALACLRPEVHFVIAGWERPPVQERLHALRAELGLENRVHFLGFRHDVPEVLNGLDAYLSTSVTEGFSLTTIQAMACGLPVVCTRSGGPEEIVTDGVDGLLVPVGDVDAISTAVASVLGDASLRERLEARSRQTVLDRFTVAGMVRAYEAVYGEVTGR